ncbi:Chitin binding domain [Seminavis robusta]|uniref:Chitin binding domain n=1 Tax=Seminavis robusta TaxID=568900 RepID=A0A9N8HN17_9STRA|nr:Chitin binding domain [Seminavis robusta]|eukprot:Sro789_g202660.1 Chitin binding domain (784) ;mRNA; f:24175-26897
MKFVSPLSVFFLSSSSSISVVSGHGYLKTPRSRNYVAKQDGVSWGGSNTDPAPEFCPQCLNRGGIVAACGKIGDHNYDYPPNAIGGVLPPNVQMVAKKGGSIDVDVVLTAHHKGHFSFYACPMVGGEVPTEDCFKSNPLEFEEDLLYGALQDPSHKDRAYIPPLTYDGIIDDTESAVPGTLYSYKMKLPPSIEGDLVLLQWHYLSANSCVHEGYGDYAFPSAWGDLGYEQLPLCGPLPADGDGVPEMFWNCAEIRVEGEEGAPTTLPAPAPAPTTFVPAPVPAPTTSSPLPPPSVLPSEGNTRMIAYLGNWQACPTAAQLAQYTHIVIAFAVSYTWAPNKNQCSPTCEIATPPICNNAANPSLLNDLRAQGKKIIVSFGGAGMGGSWAGDQNDCWEYCYGRESNVVAQLTSIVDDLGADGVDIDYEYFYEDNQNGSGFSKGTQAQNFLTQVTVGLRNSLAPNAIVTHAPMDVDMEPNTMYYQLLKDISFTLDFLMPQYYNGVTRPVVDGIDGTGAGSSSALVHYSTLVDDLFNGDATRMIFGFCISDCSGTGSNADANQAAELITSLAQHYSCNGGAFFWVAEADREGSWSSVVNQVMISSSTCSASTDSPTPIPPSTPNPTSRTQGTPTPTPTPTTQGTSAPSTSASTLLPTNSATGDLVVSSGSRCGVSELAARANCGSECSSNTDCAANEYCWNVQANLCGNRPGFRLCDDLPGKANGNARCGSNELLARETCGDSCSTNEDCHGPGEYCFATHLNSCDCVAEFGDGQRRRLLRGAFSSS